MDSDETTLMGTTPEPDYDSSPDIAVDGTLKDAESEKEENSPVGSSRPISRKLRSIYYSIRGFALAPLGLVRRYLIPLLAFCIVFGGGLYLLYTLL
ncbi:MAG: hypothetical protein ABEH35_01410 [Haloarculaceae archaeon]